MYLKFYIEYIYLYNLCIVNINLHINDALFNSCAKERSQCYEKVSGWLQFG
jgi:hypothetical protein